jgi:DNA-binding transcriptional ArsR family regulator
MVTSTLEQLRSAQRAGTPGDADISAVAALLAEPSRARIVLALADGRALPASTLAVEAGVAPSTASAHLARLLDGGLVSMLPQGRHRYYRLAGEDVGELVELLARLAPPSPVRSLREGTRAQALRAGRTCYDHLAGQLGVELFAGMIAKGWVTGGDGSHHPEAAVRDRFSAPGRDLDYHLTPAGLNGLRALGVTLPDPARDGGLALRYCVDWTEQRHHVSGVVGRALAERLIERGSIRRLARGRAVKLTDAGRRELRLLLGDAA